MAANVPIVGCELHAHLHVRTLERVEGGNSITCKATGLEFWSAAEPPEGPCNLDHHADLHFEFGRV